MVNYIILICQLAIFGFIGASALDVRNKLERAELYIASVANDMTKNNVERVVVSDIYEDEGKTFIVTTHNDKVKLTFSLPDHHVGNLKIGDSTTYERKVVSDRCFIEGGDEYLSSVMLACDPNLAIASNYLKEILRPSLIWKSIVLFVLLLTIIFTFNRGDDNARTKTFKETAD